MTLSRNRVRWAVACVLAAACGPAVLFAQTEKVNAVIGEQVRAEQAAQASQKKVDQLDEETTRMLTDYRQAIAEAQSRKAYNDQLEVQVNAQKAEMATITRQLSEIETTAREVMPMMQKMMSTLEQFVKLDMPFLPEERSNRIAQLKDTMSRSDVSISEKYRRLVEAYQIEMEYGRTLEAYQGQVGDKTVEFMRAGRIALLYQTLDGREAGYWDLNEKKWKVDNSYRDAVVEGLKVAKKQSAPDFVAVAVPAPKEIS